jgi:ribosome biogenesis GTPase A
MPAVLLTVTATSIHCTSENVKKTVYVITKILLARIPLFSENVRIPDQKGQLIDHKPRNVIFRNIS